MSNCLFCKASNFERINCQQFKIIISRKLLINFKLKNYLILNLDLILLALDCKTSVFQSKIKIHFFASLQISEVSRINMYGPQAKCVENHLYDLRKYCYCKD